MLPVDPLATPARRTPRALPPRRLAASLVRGLLVAWLALAAPRPALASAPRGSMSARLEASDRSVRTVRFATPVRVEAWDLGHDEAVRRWLREALPGFEAATADDDFGVREEPAASGLRRLRAAQTWRGLPVLDAELMIRMDEAGGVHFVSGRAVSGLRVDPTPACSDALARVAALEALPWRDPAALLTSRLEVQRAAGTDRLVYTVRASAPEHGHDALVVVSAVSGAVLEVRDLAAPAVGTVFTGPPPAGATDVPLLRLRGAGAHLDGEVLAVENYVSGSAESATGDFRFPPGSDHFPEVNAYWHIDWFVHDVLGGLGYAGLPEPLIVRVEEWLQPYVAITSGRYVKMGRPISGFANDSAWDRDLLIHEAQHAVTFGFGIQRGGTNGEPMAVHEALSDYFAAVATGDPAIGEWCYVPFPNGVSRVDAPRDPFNFDHFDAVAFGGSAQGTPWANGMILSGALWDLRAVLGTTADSLVLESLGSLASSPMFSDVFDAMLHADGEFHGGRHFDAIGEAFRGRAIRGATHVVWSGPDTLALGATGEFRAARCCAPGPFRFTWVLRKYCGGTPCPEGWSVVGDSATVHVVAAQDFDLKVNIQDWNGDPLVELRHITVVRPTAAVRGPTQRVPGEPGRYRAEFCCNVPVADVSWSVRRGCAGTGTCTGPWTALPGGLEVELADSTDFELRAHLLDPYGNAADTTLRVRVHPPTIAILGPAALPAGTPASYTVSVCCGDSAVRVQWQVLGYCWGAPCAAGWMDAGEGAQATLTFTDDAELRALVTDRYGNLVQGARLVAVRAPQVAVHGPAHVHPADRGRWVAEAYGLAPLQYQWWIRRASAPAFRVVAGTTRTLELVEPGSFVLDVDVTDRLARTTTARESVEVTTVIGADSLADAAGGPPRISFGAGNREIAIRARTGADVRLSVFDAGGREVAVLFRGRLARVEQRVRWDPQRLPSGLYFCRLVAGSEAAMRKFSVVR